MKLNSDLIKEKANLSTTPQTTSDDRKINEISLGWDSVNNTGYTLQINGHTGGQDIDFSTLLPTNTYNSFAMAKMPFYLGDSESRTFNPTANGIYMFFNTHIYRGTAHLIMVHPSVGINVVPMFGSSSNLSRVTIVQEGSSIRISVDGQCRGFLFVLNANT